MLFGYQMQHSLFGSLCIRLLGFFFNTNTDPDPTPSLSSRSRSSAVSVRRKENNMVY
ncbi:hypothetical protein HanXRQr2_Chr09g0416201 [Helianthus annuus]|uniref:Uncharacterized protein n=1 Tax=Helianthus annuus TaxID=4232 RepID=A0A9K3NAQ7_HELAN|nr:hypothetical protein HanXRQr2_Chr09g0416201 [Helianthus annuus]KAJ0528169.1 hypothetical protein HanHA300_Chr09g0342221 [Helianthus annuus]KAJ0537047.1 hypothetical protein HanIR_Chr09g0448441 [Helianthus annuus]KAJ0544598.1 hypothetical protein HanHA89_Chr09g0363441 [Helianthus annuus]KAJ0895608.1 hypothetical protein HanPSC8_Chr09g0402491 [Helianthus annuus]